MKEFMTLENQLCFAIYETSSEFTKLYTSALRSFELTFPQYLVLLALWEKDGLTVKELGQTLKLGTGTLTPMLARMEAKGWLRKERSTEDERCVNIHLLPKAIEEKPLIHQKVAEEVLTCGIEFEEYQQLMQQLQLLKGKLKSRK
ncbi:MarR family transcriptional regulator [Anaerobacillus alkaliphilus]|uniref:MarR family transcriptional regulator n=1 Tax=Anaerobacillus alkaliphilus TaxID=1548597 RepID=A0A4Q0VSF1_9BACI|nr:MarR family transcriptional regulator [Anaerobacillus alkaliphilus]RXJ00266.1 MarR family transcriptional regulator [Anaerobacillus alkaliphilus]